MKKSLHKLYYNQGYIVLDILSEKEISETKNVLDLIAQRDEYRSQNKLIQISFLQPSAKACAIHPIIHHQKILNVIEHLLKPDLIIDNAAIFLADRGISYKLGWHRDVLQVPEHLIQDEWFSNSKFHNNVQVNLAITADSCFWIVPGSHSHPNSELEKLSFNGSKHLSPLEAKMPHAVRIKLKPGQAIFYNNNAIHRGYNEALENARRTIHLGYHTSREQPTYHFNVLKFYEYTDDYLAKLSPPVKEMLRKHISERLKYVDPYDTHSHHQKFLKAAF